MNIVSALVSLRVLALALATAFAVSASAAPLAAPSVAPRALPAQVDCYSIGQQVASQNGGTLARATPQNQGGQTVCVIVVLMPAKDGKRPRRVEFTVPPG